MGEVTKFPTEMQPARPYPPKDYTDPREQAVQLEWVSLAAVEALTALVRELGSEQVTKCLRMAEYLVRQENGQ